ncbi:MAG: 4-hydroxy-tetrahydrodipicolinate reductase [Desulfurispora sp.]|uniref:4-hydroxy-tetrahydrodipicolinate reductase n=1 Tax=Desulfurispora sp. TaxID=3014275 RepID=UPI004048F066
MIKVLVSGAAGRMGREVLKTVFHSDDMVLVGAVDPVAAGQSAAALTGLAELSLVVEADLAEALKRYSPDVMVDFTTPRSVAGNVELALQAGVRPVVGTTGLAAADIERLSRLAAEKKLGGIIAPNFAIGAILMMQFAVAASKYFPHCEIIELHHDQKLDAPSGTAIKTAELIAARRGDFVQGLPAEVEKIPGARGGEFSGGIRIHSVRLPGFVAHQEVIFGGLGQTLTIRHDSISRESFMPGVQLAIRRVMELKEMVYGLEKVILED